MVDNPTHHHHIRVGFGLSRSEDSAHTHNAMQVLHTVHATPHDTATLLRTTGSWARPTPQHLVTHSLGLSWRAVTPKDSSRSSWSGPVSNLPLSSTSTYDAPQTNEAPLSKGVLGSLGSSRGSTGRRHSVPTQFAQGGAREGVLSDAPHGEAHVEMWRAPVCKRGLLHEINGRVPRDLDCK